VNDPTILVADEDDDARIILALVWALEAWLIKWAAR
jgi:hypothetical protein